MQRIALAIAIVLTLTACNKGTTITDEPAPAPPKIVLTGETGVYALRLGQSLTLDPQVENDVQGQYQWFVDDSPVTSLGKAYTFIAEVEGVYYLRFRVSTPYGSDEEEFRVDVSEAARPLISFAVPGDRMEVVVGAEYTFRPVVANATGGAYRWLVDGQVVGEGTVGREAVEYRFRAEEAGTYTLSLQVEGPGGTAEKAVQLDAVDRLALNLFFEAPMFTQPLTEITVFQGQSLLLWPVVEGGVEPLKYRWTIDGELSAENDERLLFTPESEGEYAIEVAVEAVSDEVDPVAVARGVTRSGGFSAQAKIRVICSGEEASGRRPVGSGSSPWSTTVYEYIPAPGQFINEDLSGFAGEETPEAAARYAQRRLAEGHYVSLGGFGGFITVGFDHSIENRGAFHGYDFAIAGNQMASSSEPGVVWVMQDANGNGLPDDVWYELRGSESGDTEADTRYAVTYVRPSGAGSAVPWRDNRGETGQVDYLPAYHRQESYYPRWIADSYTLRGTRLRPTISEGGLGVSVEPLPWGYADNFGVDRLLPGDDSQADNPEAEAAYVYFQIARAMHPDGTPADLQYIDFIKVQSASNAQGGPAIGELSTEVFSFRDMNND
jgi:hypothetical protein